MSRATVTAGNIPWWAVTPFQGTAVKDTDIVVIATVTTTTIYGIIDLIPTKARRNRCKKQRNSSTKREHK